MELKVSISKKQWEDILKAANIEISELTVKLAIAVTMAQKARVDIKKFTDDDKNQKLKEVPSTGSEEEIDA